MDFMLKLTILTLGISFVIAVFFLLVTRRINERASVPWIAGSFIIILFSLMPSLLEVVTDALGVDYPPALLFLIAILIILLLLLYQSIHISMLQNKCQELAQHLAIISSRDNIDLHSRIIKPEDSVDTSSMTGSTDLMFVQSKNISLN